MELDHLGGTYGGNRKPTPFMCLVTKVLQIQPEKDIVVEFINVLEDDFEKEEEREENEQLDGLDNGADERDYCHERSPARERDRDRRRDSRRYRQVASSF
ncbi:hypothetical protein Peur_012327 [Populus x canadensis]